MQRVWSTYLAPSNSLGSMSEFTSRPMRSQDSFGSVRSDISTNSRRRLVPGANLRNNSSVDDYPPDYSRNRKAHVLDDYVPHYTPNSRAPYSNAYDSDLDFSFASTTDVSLSVNYLPSKVSEVRNRKGGKYNDEPNIPKSGGGIYAFGSYESRMPKGNGRWNKFKWILFATNSLLTLYSLAALIVCLLTWFDVWEKSFVIRTGNAPELILSTMTAIIGLFTSLIGWAGILLNNRGFLAWYTFLTWVTFAFLVSPGYMTYKRRTFNLEGKINAQWSRNINAKGRMLIQNQLNCCGYFSPFVEATVTQTCYARSILPGCKGPYILFEKALLAHWYKVVFALVPSHILIMVAGLLCSNNITYRFGKGMMPEAYRLNVGSMSMIMDDYADQLADHYGADVVNKILRRFRSKTHRGNTSIPGATRSSHRRKIPLYPFKSKYGQIHS